MSSITFLDTFLVSNVSNKNTLYMITHKSIYITPLHV